MSRLLFLIIVFSNTGLAQTKAIKVYFGSPVARADADALAKTPPGTRNQMELQGLLPHRRSNSFVEYVKAKSFPGLLDSIESVRLNKLVGSAGGGSGATSLVSRVAVPAVLGFGVEYGSILQENNGTVSTLRGNLLGIARMAFGGEQFPYCPEIDQKNCSSATRWLRRFSASVSFEDIRAKTGSVSAIPATAAPVVVDLFGNDFRMASWGARFDLTLSNNLDDPQYISAWKEAIEGQAKDSSAPTLSKAVVDLFSQALDQEVYSTWMAETVANLQQAPTAAEFYKVLEERLDLLIQRMSNTESDFGKKVNALARAYSNYFDVRDGLLRKLQRHQLSLEYTNHHSPSTSNIRLIYSHQPTQSPTLVTVNAAFTFYNHSPTGNKSGRLRDAQFAGQLDRRLGQIPHFGNAVATLAGYYQWMKEDALISIGSGNIAPGSGIVLPSTAATLLGTKGHIGIVQGKLSVPINTTLKIPVSITWANRTELIKEKDVRGQIGLTLDIDSLFH